jgi:rSAM/selenodomain-associated transferase 2
MPATFSVIIPTLNEASVLGGTLAAVSRLPGAVEIIVVDGGSDDGTPAIAHSHQAQVHRAPRGRGSQMRAGADAARGEILWFLHADTHPPADAVEQIADALQDPQVIAGSFAVQFDGESFAARFLTWLYPSLGRLGLCYGDSAIFVRRTAYDWIGGFRPLLLFEDLDLVRRLKRAGRFVRLPGPVVTSSRRFEGRSFPLIFLRWTMLQILYWLGVKPRLLARFYAPVHRSK